MRSYLKSFSHLFYPHVCEGCGTDYLFDNQFICSRCVHRLPETKFFAAAGNPIEKLFYGRCQVEMAGAAFYFSKQSLMQHLLMQLKYKGNREAGYFLGRMMGNALGASGRFEGIDALVPLPLNAKREFRRGYNQALLICEGISASWPRPVLRNVVERTRFTDTQTRKDRLSRWQNMEQAFRVSNAALLKHRHILLVDDVITTGATLEACGNILLEIPGTRLSIAAAAFTA